jgi:hypothetical protein
MRVVAFLCRHEGGRSGQELGSALSDAVTAYFIVENLAEAAERHIEAELSGAASGRLTTPATRTNSRLRGTAVAKALSEAAARL